MSGLTHTYVLQAKDWPELLDWSGSIADAKQTSSSSKKLSRSFTTTKNEVFAQKSDGREWQILNVGCSKEDTL